MASVKKFSNNLIIQTPKDTGANITLDTDFVYIKGNLNVLGTQTSIQTVNSQVTDNIFALNAGEPGWGVGGNASPGTSGIEVDRGLQANVSLRWNESYLKWEIFDGTNYGNLVTSTTAGISAVVDDTSPELGGNLVTNGFHIQLNTPTVNPPVGNVAGISLLYAANVGSAGSGLFVVNSETASEELVTKSKAIVFSIIL